MTLWEAIAAGLPLAIRPSGDETNDRLICEAFRIPNGLVFLDTGWQDSDGAHPAHKVFGEITGGGPWQIGEAVVRVIEDGDPLAERRNRWDKYLATDDGTRYTRDRAHAELVANAYIPA